VKIVFLDSGTLGSAGDVAIFGELGELEVYEFTYPREVEARIRDANVVITNKVTVDHGAILSARSLELIVVTASVVDGIDLAAARSRGVQVLPIPGYATESVAQMTWCLILSLLCRIRHFAAYVESGNYSSQRYFSHLGDGFTQVWGRRVGIIGLGRIGERVAEIGQVMGADVVYHSTTGANANSRYQRVDLTELLKTSHIVSIHAPLNADTTNLLDGRELALMRRDAILVNTARGGIVNEDDLASALAVGTIRAAALDVFEREPLAADSPLMSLAGTENLLLTPHCAWGGDIAQTDLMSSTYRTIAEYIRQRHNE
jgi:lactate dehydrogenase-like 2-hydroxyacid dehydrogenase